MRSADHNFIPYLISLYKYKSTIVCAMGRTFLAFSFNEVTYILSVTRILQESQCVTSKESELQKQIAQDIQITKHLFTSTLIFRRNNRRSQRILFSMTSRQILIRASHFYVIHYLFFLLPITTRSQVRARFSTQGIKRSSRCLTPVYSRIR